jgi:hypothetical protein
VLATLTNWALRENVDVVGLTVERLTLEDVYLRLTGYEPDTEASSYRGRGTRDGRSSSRPAFAGWATSSSRVARSITSSSTSG